MVMRKRRGISEILAAVIILVITTVLGVTLLNFSLAQTGSQSNALVSATSDQEALTKERINVISVAVTSDKKLNVTFINYGKDDVIISDVYVNNIRYHPTIVNPVTNTIESVTHTLVIDYALINLSNYQSNTEYYIVLVSSRGGSTSYDYKSPIS